VSVLERFDIEFFHLHDSADHAIKPYQRQGEIFCLSVAIGTIPTGYFAVAR
jgi:hypothetical protein